MNKIMKLATILVILYSGVLIGQTSNDFSKSITPVVSISLSNSSYAQEFESRFFDSDNFSLTIEESSRLGIGFLYQMENTKGHYYRLGIENFSISKSNSFITNDVPPREAVNNNSANSFKLIGHLEYGKYFFPGFSDKFKIAIGVTASPYTSKYKHIPVNSLSVNYRLFQHGVDLGLSPRVTMKLSSLIEIDLSIVAKLIHTNYSSLNYEDPSLNADERNLREFNVSANDQRLSAMLGLKFNLLRHD